jgi:hypothetical protein
MEIMKRELVPVCFSLFLSGAFLGTADAEPFFNTAYLRDASFEVPAIRPALPSDNDDQPGGEMRGPTISGSRAVLKNGVAYAPSAAPRKVKKAIWAVNSLRRKPYRWGGGHGSFQDSGYDCSGTVSFALHGAEAADAPMDSRALMNFGDRGRGRWFTIYTRRGHSFAVIAGLRLDTTGYYGDEGPRWRAEAREPRGFEARHPPGL